MKRLSRTSERGVFFALLLLCGAMYALYFVHLAADYPTLLPQVDWARYTDEGWYGGAALNHIQTGRWYTPNGFNPAVALPLWPLLLRGWFALTGPGMVAARTLAVLLFGATNLLMFLLLRPLAGRVLAAAAVLLTLASPFCFGMYRLAIVEPLAGFLFVLALWVASCRHENRSAAAGVGRSVLVGLLLALMVLTKSTAVVQAPAVLLMLWFRARRGRSESMQTESAPKYSLCRMLADILRDWKALVPPLLTGAAAFGLWLLYFFVLVRPHHLADYHHLFHVNRGHASGHTLLRALAHALGDGTWMGGLVYGLALLLIAASVRYLRELWRVPLFATAVLALLLPIALIGWHTWFLPHYYMACVAPMMMALTLAVHALARRAHAPYAPVRVRAAHTVAMLALEVAFAVMLVETLSTALHPRYTYAQAAEDMARRMRAQAVGGEQPLLLAGSAEDVALFTGVRGINPEWPIGGLPALVQQEKPGWYGGYLPWDARRIATMRSLLPLEEVARYEIQPDPDHQVFVLYRIRPTARPAH